MGTFKRCDRCGAEIVFEKETMISMVKDAFNGLVKAISGEDTVDYFINTVNYDNGRLDRLDLCPKCHDELVSWLKSGGDSNENNESN